MTRTPLAISKLFFLTVLIGFTLCGCTTTKRTPANQDLVPKTKTDPKKTLENDYERPFMNDRGPSSEPSFLTTSFEYMTSLERLRATLNLSKDIESKLPHKGTPSYKLFAHFNHGFEQAAARLENQILELKAGRQLNWVPSPNNSKENETISTLYKTAYAAYASFYTLDKLTIFLNSKGIVDADPLEVITESRLLTRPFTEYKEATSKNILLLKPEDRERANMAAQTSYVRMLSRGVLKDLPNFVPNKKNLEQHRTLLNQLSKMTTASAAGVSAKVFNGVGWKNLYASIVNKINLPGSSEIDGAQDDFDKVMNVQLGIEMLQYLYDNGLRGKIK